MEILIVALSALGAGLAFYLILGAHEYIDGVNEPGLTRKLRKK